VKVGTNEKMGKTPLCTLDLLGSTEGIAKLQNSKIIYWSKSNWPLHQIANFSRNLHELN